MSLISTLVIIYGIFCLLLYVFQRNILYHPTPDVPALYTNRLSLRSEGEDLSILHIDHESRVAIIYFGGNAEPVAYNVTEFVKFFPEQDTYFANYRGYGGSTGAASEQALFADALTLYDYVKQNHDTIIVIGRSLGSGVAVYLATQRELAKLILVTPFDSMENVARMSMPVFPISLLIKDKFESYKRVGLLKVLTLIVIAGMDQVIPRVRTEALIAAYPREWLTVEVVEQASHNDLSSYDEYWGLLVGFLSS